MKTKNIFTHPLWGKVTLHIMLTYPYAMVNTNYGIKKIKTDDLT